MDDLLRLQKLHRPVDPDKGDRLKSEHCWHHTKSKSPSSREKSRNELNIQKIVQGALIKMKNVRRIHCPMPLPVKKLCCFTRIKIEAKFFMKFLGEE